MFTNQLLTVADVLYTVDYNATNDMYAIMLTEADVNIVVDHFGQISDDKGLDCPGFQYFLKTAESGRGWVKISAWYRLSSSYTVALKLAKEVARRILQPIGASRLLYGSDWPHTEHENYPLVRECCLVFDELITDPIDWEKILSLTPMKLFEFQYS